MIFLLAGCAGYIGSHIIIELDKAGHSVVVVVMRHKNRVEI